MLLLGGHPLLGRFGGLTFGASRAHSFAFPRCALCMGGGVARSDAPSIEAGRAKHGCHASFTKEAMSFENNDLPLGL